MSVACPWYVCRKLILLLPGTIVHICNGCNSIYRQHYRAIWENWTGLVNLQHTRTELYKSTSGFYSAFKWIMFAMVFFVSLYTFFILLLCNVFLFWYWFVLPFSTSSQTVWSLPLTGCTFCGQHFLSKIRDSQVTEICLIKLSVLLVVSLDQTLHLTYLLSHEMYPR